MSRKFTIGRSNAGLLEAASYTGATTVVFIWAVLLYTQMAKHLPAQDGIDVAGLAGQIFGYMAFAAAAVTIGLAGLWISRTARSTRQTTPGS